MAAFFVDLDGTLFNFGTNDFASNAQEFLSWIKDNNHQLILTTYRGGDDFKNHPIFDKDKTLKALKELDVEYDHILFSIVSPRIVINDDPCASFQVEPNGGLLDALNLFKRRNYE